MSRLLAEKPAAVEQSGWPTGTLPRAAESRRPSRLSHLLPAPSEQTGLNADDSAGGRQRRCSAGHSCNY